MKNSELKRLIKSAYSIEASRKNEFIKNYQRRELNYRELLRVQLQYMGAQLMAICGYALAMLLGSLANIDVKLAKIVAVLAPLAALFALTGLGKSEKYGMEEIEMSSRFSLRTIMIIRLAIIGIAGLAIMLAASCALSAVTGMNLFVSFAAAGVPYLITTFLCMLLIRRWHSPKNIYGCVVIAAGVCAAMFGGIDILERCCAGLYRSALSGVLLISAGLTAVEVCAYIRESEDHAEARRRCDGSSRGERCRKDNAHEDDLRNLKAYKRLDLLRRNRCVRGIIQRCLGLSPAEFRLLSVLYGQRFPAVYRRVKGS